jgi:hypothetical protein
MFDEAILEAVIGDDRDSPAGPENPNRGAKPVFERAELIVDRDPKRLEDERGGIVFPAASDAESPDQIDEIRGGFERGCISLCHDGAGQSPRARKLTVFREDFLQILGGEVCE